MEQSKKSNHLLNKHHLTIYNMLNTDGVCQCLYEIENDLPRTKFCQIPCKEQRMIQKYIQPDDTMENKVKIAQYRLNEDNSFTLTGYDEYVITYLKGVKPHHLRVVVNGRLTTNKEISILNNKQPYKAIILEAIYNYKYGLFKNNDLVIKKLKLSTLSAIYKRGIISALKNKLLAIRVEKCRDTLTEFKLI